MTNVLEYWIRAKDATAGAIQSALTRIKRFGAEVGRNLTNIKSGFEMVGQAVGWMWQKLQKAVEFEKMTYQFKTLIGNLDEARAHMRMLQELGDTPPFSLEEFAKASRQLMVMSEGVLGYKKSLEMVGDAAAATGQSVEQLGHEIGRAYAIIRDGQPLSRATMSLKNMGVITPEVAAKLDELQKAGASSTEIWNTLTEHLKRFKGAMEETEQTADGLMGAVGAQWDDAVRSFGAALLGVSKDGMKGLLDKMKELNEDGTIELWADNVKSALEAVVEAFKSAAQGVKNVWEYSGLADVWGIVKGTIGGGAASVTRTVAGIANGEGVWSSLKAGGKEGTDYRNKAIVQSGGYLGAAAKRGWFGKTMQGYANEADEDAAAEAERKQTIKDNARAAKLKQREKDKAIIAKQTAQEEEKVLAALQAKQAERERKAAEDKAKYLKENEKAVAEARLDAEAKAIDAANNKNDKVAQKRAEQAKKFADALAKVTDKEAEKRLRDEDALANKRLDNEKKIADYAAKKLKDGLEREKVQAQSMMQDLEHNLDAADKRLTEAQQKVEKAWGWYKDKSTMQTAIDEYKEQKAAETQWAKDFEKLKSKRRDWRDIEFGQLSAEEEAVRQVALAKEEEQAAQKALDELVAQAEEQTAKLNEIVKKLSSEEEA